MNREQYMLNEAKARMKKLYEYSFYRNGVFEDGEQDMNAGAPADPNAMGGDPNAMGMDPSMQGGDPNAMGGDPMGGGDPNAMGGEVNGANLAPNAGMDNGDPNAMGMDPSMQGGDPNAMGGDPMGGGDPNAMGAQPGPDDDVVDITDLTNAQNDMQQSQEQISDQMSDVNQKLTTLLKVVDKFREALNVNDEKIRDLKREIVKRSPTEEETMNVRLSAGGNPFDQKPEEFWGKFQDINNHYNITANNNAPQYQIRKSDIDNFNDKMVDDSFEYDDIPGSLKEYFNR